MTPEKRVLVASALSALVLIAYAQLFRQPGKSSQTPALQQSVESSQDTYPEQVKSNEEEQSVGVESPFLRLNIGTSSASINSVVLKGFKNIQNGQPMEFGHLYPIILAECGDKKKWKFVTHGDNNATWTCNENGILTTLKLSADNAHPIFTLNFYIKNQTNNEFQQRFPITATWEHGEKNPHVRIAPIEVVLKTEKRLPTQRAYLTYREGSARFVPRETSIATLSERFFCESVKFGEANKPLINIVRSPRGTIVVSANISKVVPANANVVYSIPVYVGPRDFFWLRDAGFQDALPVGFLGKIGLFLMLILKWLASITKSYGLGIILLSALVTLSLSPFTLTSLRSMKKMHALQPKIDQLRRKYEKDQARLNQEMFALFKEYRVSPLSGCLPMLLPLPIFFALWSAISHVIELRGASFLWIKDLTLPDRLAKLPFGFDLNLLPLIMTGLMYFQSQMSQKLMPRNDSNQILSGPLMSIIFGVMFYTVPACLVLYWVMNSLVTISIYTIFGRKIDAASA